MLGYRGRDDWRDMSEYVVHFTKDAVDGTSAYSVLISILSSGALRSFQPYGAARWSNVLRETQLAACFSGIPLDRLGRLVERRSSYGLAFTQEFVTRAGGGRVWYVDNDGPLATKIRELVANRSRPHIDIGDPLWRLTPFIDFPGMYSGVQAGQQQPYRFEWEREWRVPGQLRFTPEDVSFLFVPERLHGQARWFFEDAKRTNSGPAYLCPYLDPGWSDERLQLAFSSVTPPAE